jgi:hypothetical protein
MTFKPRTKLNGLTIKDGPVRILDEPKREIADNPYDAKVCEGSFCRIKPATWDLVSDMHGECTKFFSSGMRGMLLFYTCSIFYWQ